MNKFQLVIPIDEALDWTLHKESLRDALVDAAEEQAVKKHPRFSEIDTDTTLIRDDKNFTITFTWEG